MRLGQSFLKKMKRKTLTTFYFVLIGECVAMAIFPPSLLQNGTDRLLAAFHPPSLSTSHTALLLPPVPAG